MALRNTGRSMATLVAAHADYNGDQYFLSDDDVEIPKMSPGAETVVIWYRFVDLDAGPITITVRWQDEHSNSYDAVYPLRLP